MINVDLPVLTGPTTPIYMSPFVLFDIFSLINIEMECNEMERKVVIFDHPLILHFLPPSKLNTNIFYYATFMIKNKIIYITFKKEAKYTSFLFYLYY